ncbi:hypothetical protein KQ874_03020 [Mycoplasma sp. ES3157-GEN-MYC]|uniref:Uncharacterized protein n=1 Tax=Mycoplasma miroungigenitalium TaxID=754515 RepID=A0A6M4J9Z7_9MOLU|nr:hypothetical protein [Mycoplasma miroungigenitalium]MBU4690649.1 hypothetical protein [Mycoplasma miroungigenitalium]QJR43773.1 hypothetical protein HLA87_03225 [Mycoplasma miroungigenitalium]
MIDDALNAIRDGYKLAYAFIDQVIEDDKTKDKSRNVFNGNRLWFYNFQKDDWTEMPPLPNLE